MIRFPDGRFLTVRSNVVRAARSVRDPAPRLKLNVGAKTDRNSDPPYTTRMRIRVAHYDKSHSHASNAELHFLAPALSAESNGKFIFSAFVFKKKNVSCTLRRFLAQSKQYEDT